MASTSTTTVSQTVTGDGVTTNTAESDAQNTNTAPPTTLLTSNGFNAVSIPTGYTITSVTLVPPANSVITKTLKGVTGDTGIVLQTTGATKIAINSGASIGLACNGIETVRLIWG